MAPFFFFHPSLPSPGGKAWSFRAEAPKGFAVREGFFCSGGGVLWGAFWVRFSFRPLAGASRLGDMRVLPSLFFQHFATIFSRADVLFIKP